MGAALALACMIVVASTSLVPASTAAGPSGLVGSAHWTSTAGAPQPGGAILVRLRTGKVLVIHYQTSELYDPATGRFGQSAALFPADYQYPYGPSVNSRDSVAVLLRDGRVMVFGGHTGRWPIYDPATNTWADRSPPADRDIDGPLGVSATLLPDGRVFVAGGEDILGHPYTYYSQMAWLYDPVGDTWQDAPRMIAGSRGHHAAVLLPNGKVLIIGGCEVGAPIPPPGSPPGDYHPCTGAPEYYPTIYDPASNSWSHTAGAVLPARAYPSAVRLLDGRVLVFGGRHAQAGADDSYNHSALQDAWLYSPTSNTWRSAGTMSQARMSPAVVILATGKVLVSGGSSTDVYNDDRGLLASAELYDPATNRWTPTVSMRTAFQFPTGELLPAGQALIVGDAPSATAELYYPALPPLVAARCAVSVSTGSTHGKLLISQPQGYMGRACADTWHGPEYRRPGNSSTSGSASIDWSTRLVSTTSSRRAAGLSLIHHFPTEARLNVSVPRTIDGKRASPLSGYVIITESSASTLNAQVEVAAAIRLAANRYVVARFSLLEPLSSEYLVGDTATAGAVWNLQTAQALVHGLAFAQNRTRKRHR